MSLVHVFAFLLLVAPCPRLPGAGTNAINGADTVWRTSQTNLVQATVTAFRNIATGAKTLGIPEKLARNL